jgi:hypothetical protein
MEGFHVLATHPDFILSRHPIRYLRQNVPRFLQNLSTGNPHMDQTDAEIHHELGNNPDDLPEAKTA